MPHSIPTRLRLTATLGVCLLLAGCGGSSRSTAPVPGIQPQIVNLTDDFSYQISSVDRFTGTSSYSWENTGAVANVNQSTTVTTGGITLTIRDAVGAQVYSQSLADNGTFVTGSGVAGRWTIQVTYATGSGTVNFRAQKKT